MPVLRLSLDIAIPLALLLAALAFAAGQYVYLSAVPAISRSRRVLLGLLRGGTLASFVLLILSPVLTIVRTSSRLPFLTVLVDASESMEAGEHRRRPADEVSAVMESRAYRDVTSAADVRMFTFGARLRRLPAGDSIAFDEPATDLAGALAGLRKESGRSPIDAVLLLSDGIITAGQHPRYEAAELPAPVYGIAVGNRTGNRDITVAGLQANEIVTAGTTSPVQVDIHATDMAGGRTEVQLLDGARILDRVPLPLVQGTRDYRLQLSYTPEAPGVKTLTARVTPAVGEMTTTNNVRSKAVRVVKSRALLLVLAGLPSPDIPAVRQTLAEDPAFDVRSFTQRPSGEFYEGDLPRSLLDSADCILFLGFPTPVTPSSTVENLRSTLETRSLPLLFAGGRSVDHTRLAAFATHLPVVPELASTREHSVSFEPSADQRGNQLLSLGETDGFERWKSLPPLFATPSTYRPRTGAVVLGSGRIQGTEIREPLLVIRAAGRVRSLALLGYGLWRWRLMAQRSPGTSDFFARFLGMGVRWLCSGEESRPVRVDLATTTPYQGEPVRFFGQVYDAALRPVDNARVRVVVRGNAGELALDLRSTGNGRYEGSLDGPPAGSFTYSAEAEADGIRYGEDHGTFVVGGVSLELQDTRMDEQTLREIAAVTGGASATLDGADSLLQRLRAAPVMSERQEETVETVEFRHWPFSLAVLVLLLSAEWVLRKRYGMV